MITNPAKDKMIKYSPFKKRALSSRPLAETPKPPSVKAKRAFIETKEYK
jgi:hypothetical protein